MNKEQPRVYRMPAHPLAFQAKAGKKLHKFKKVAIIHFSTKKSNKTATRATHIYQKDNKQKEKLTKFYKTELQTHINMQKQE